METRPLTTIEEIEKKISWLQEKVVDMSLILEKQSEFNDLLLKAIARIQTDSEPLKSM